MRQFISRQMGALKKVLQAARRLMHFGHVRHFEWKIERED